MRCGEIGEETEILFECARVNLGAAGPQWHGGWQRTVYRDGVSLVRDSAMGRIDLKSEFRFRVRLFKMTFDPNDALCEAFRQHGIRAIVTTDGVSLPQSDLLVSASIVRIDRHPKTVVVQLDVRVFSKQISSGPLIESISGWADDEDQAAKLAFSKFLQASFHVIMAVLVEESLGREQVEWESWNSAGKRWRVCMGPLILQGSPPEEMQIGGLLDQVRDHLLLDLSHRVHWMRLYLWKNGEGRFGSEALLDNSDWPPAHALVDSWRWPSGDYSARLFLMMVPE